MGPDFTAFERFAATTMRGGGDSAVSVIESGIPGGAPYMHIDLARYANDTPAAQRQTQERLDAHLRERQIPESMRREMAAYIDEARGGQPLADAGGGTSYYHMRLFMTDARTVSQTEEISDVLQRHTPYLPRELDSLALQKVRLHEAAHSMLNLNEPGSDFVAAAIMLRDNPQSRQMLENDADLRLLYGIERGVPSVSRYGVECHDAIRRALAMTPEQLRSASIETLHAIGAEYDQQNDLNRSLGPASPEGQIIQTVSDYTGQGMFSQMLRSQWDQVARGQLPDSEAGLERMRTAQSSPDAIRTALMRTPPTDPETQRIAAAITSSTERLNAYVESQQIRPQAQMAAPQPPARTAGPSMAN